MIRSRLTFMLAVLFLASLRSFAQLGPLNWTGPVKVEANDIFLLWHDHPDVGDRSRQKTYSFDLHGDTLPPDERVIPTPSQEDDRQGAAAFTDVANGKFTMSARDNVVAVWGPVPGSGIGIMIPHFDTTAGAWSTTVQDSITGDVQEERIYVKTLDLDDDSLDEFVVAYMDNSDSIHFNLYDVDSLLQPTLITSYCDRKAIGSMPDRVRYHVETGDFDGDGDDELALSLLTALSGTDLDVTIQLYEFNGSTLEARANTVITTSYAAPLSEFELSAVAGDYIDDPKQELAIAMTLRHGSGSGNRTAHLQVIEASPDLLTIDQGSYYTPSLPPSGGLYLGTASGDLFGDARDEIVLAAGRTIHVCRMTIADSLVILPAFTAGPSSSFGDDVTRAMFDHVQVTDVDQDGRMEIVTTYDILGGGTAGFCTSIYGLDSLDLEAPLDSMVVELARLFSDEADPIPGTDPPQYEFRPYSIAVGNYDGRNFIIGQPTHHVAQGVVQPIVVLNAPPIHFDQLDSTLYDLNECYNGSACDFGATYRKASSTSVEVSTTVQSDWVVSAGLSQAGSVSFGVEESGEPLGVGVSTSQEVSFDYEWHLLASVGAHFSNTGSTGTTLTVGVEVTAQEDDRIYSTVTEYDVWEYPVYHGNETFPRSTILTYVPLNVQATWFPSKSYNAVNYVPDHEVGNVLSYPAYASLDQNPNMGQAIAADYNNDSFVLDASSNYDWFLVMNDFLSSGADTTLEAGLDLGFGYGAFRFDGDFGGKAIRTHRTSVTQQIDLNVHLGSVDMGIGDAKYTVTPYAYWDTKGALVVDYAAKPEIAPPGFPQTWWETEYGQLSDPTFILPWKLDPEKGFAISEEAKREQTKDIIISPAYPLPGDTLTITARVRNFSLVGTNAPVTVSFYLGDPDDGGTPLIGLSGTNTVSTTGPVPAQGREDVQLRWPLPDGLEAYPRIYAVLDEGGVMDEVHEGNNKGFNVLGWGSGTVGVEELLPPVKATAQIACYPNPFTSETTIDYVLPVSGRTTISVFDQVGREIETLVDAQLPAGAHTLVFDGSALPDGIYFCILRSGACTEARKMVLAR